MEDDAAAIHVIKSLSSEDDTDTGSCCPICLGPTLQPSYLDKCFHKFCFNCILRWTKVVASKHRSQPSSVKCPLCKTENFSIIHGVDGSCFQRHYVNEDFEYSFILSRAHRYRLQCYYTEQGLPSTAAYLTNFVLNNGFLDDVFNISHYWKSRKYCQPNSWLQSWLRREIQALIQEEDVDIIVYHIFGVMNASLTKREQKSHMNAPEKVQEEFKTSVSEAARPFLGARTERFVYEIQLFLASGLNIEAYDAVYIQRLGWSSPGVNTQIYDNELIDRTTVIPYMYIFNDDSDGNE